MPALGYVALVLARRKHEFAMRENACCCVLWLFT